MSCLSHPVCGILLGQPELTKTPTLVLPFLAGLFINPLGYGLRDAFTATPICKWPHWYNPTKAQCRCAALCTYRSVFGYGHDIASLCAVSVLPCDWELCSPGGPPSGEVQQTLAHRSGGACQGRWPAEVAHPEGVVLVPSSLPPTTHGLSDGGDVRQGQVLMLTEKKENTAPVSSGFTWRK